MVKVEQIDYNIKHIQYFNNIISDVLYYPGLQWEKSTACWSRQPTTLAFKLRAINLAAQKFGSQVCYTTVKMVHFMLMDYIGEATSANLYVALLCQFTSHKLEASLEKHCLRFPLCMDLCAHSVLEISQIINGVIIYQMPSNIKNQISNYLRSVALSSTIVRHHTCFTFVNECLSTSLQFKEVKFSLMVV